MRFWESNPGMSVAMRRRQAEHRLAQLVRSGRALAPVRIDGQVIAKTFWGKAWCKNLEQYSDFRSRLPRGRSYVRNGSVLDLQITPGTIAALVSGSDLYDVHVDVTPVGKPRWQAICRDCVGAIDSVVELLQGRLSTSVMTRLCEPKTGLFPAPAEVAFRCSCPDRASMCKHVAAVLYGIGARLDERPELLFVLRSVDQDQLITRADAGLRPAHSPTSTRILEMDDLSGIFGIDIARPARAVTRASAARRSAPRGRKSAPRKRRRRPR